MNSVKIRQFFEKEGSRRGWSIRFNKEKEELEVHFSPEHAPFILSIPRVLQRIKAEKGNPEEIVGDLVNQIAIVIEAAQQRDQVLLISKEREIYPVMRSSSFPTETKGGQPLIYDDHTAESRIYYAVDLGQSYTLIDESQLEDAGWTKQQLKEKALFNLHGLSQEAKLDEVAGNRFYFISPGDGYAASRILNQSLIEGYARQAEGEFCLAIPHQDVLVLADIMNDHGYDILQQVTLSFYREGDMPITMLPFKYEQGELIPIFIMARRNPRSD